MPRKASDRTDLSAEEFAVYSALLNSAALIERAVELNLREQADLTQQQFSVLMALAESPDGIRMADLADRLIVSRSGLSYQVAQLEKAGRITRTRHPDDERGIVARITPAGERLRRQVLPGHRELVRGAFFDVLTAGEQASIRDGLGRVADGLRG